MNPTTRNSLMIGGALIVTALLLTCGPMTNWFGMGKTKLDASADVAAGPPPPSADTNTAGALAAASAGAMAGAQVGTADLAGAEVGATEVAEISDGIGASAVAPRSNVGSAETDVSTASAVNPDEVIGDAGAGAAIAITAPPSSASETVPEVAVANVSVPEPAVLAAAAAASAASAFDEAFGSGSAANALPGDLSENDSLAALNTVGKVVDRFAPPVAAVGGSVLALASSGGAFGIQAGGVRASCDSPGAGCQNLLIAGGSVIVVPPIVGGVRPTP